MKEVTLGHYNVFVFGIAIACPIALSMLTACSSASDTAIDEAAHASGSRSLDDGTKNIKSIPPQSNAVGIHETPSVSGSRSLEDWKTINKSNHPPSKPGCYTLTYPSQTWSEIQCLKASDMPPRGRTSIDVMASRRVFAGNGTDWFGDVTATGSKIQKVEAGFYAVDGVTWEYDPHDSRYNSYTLQINSNSFHSPASGSYSNCSAWQQYVYSSNWWQAAWIEYWLFNYPPAGNNGCPSPMTQWDSTTCHGFGSLVSAPLVPIGDLSALTFYASAKDPEFDNALDEVWLYYNGTYYADVESATVLSLYQGWTAEEFNVVGDMNGSEAEFNSGVTLAPLALITPTPFPTGTWLSCSSTAPGIATGETNNLTLGSCSPSSSSCAGTCGSIYFTESH